MSVVLSGMSNDAAAGVMNAVPGGSLGAEDEQPAKPHAARTTAAKRSRRSMHVLTRRPQHATLSTQGRKAARGCRIGS
ncbi:hypothetical protein ACQQ2N_00990 [Dokdonella sp. MW10]|uniref:hypothetical protein n=1 Tax=Dokdonella sp. MW10 TaxID=2992926 RepID=UPI003F821865